MEYHQLELDTEYKGNKKPNSAEILEFFENTVHDIKTPATIVFLTAQSMEKDPKITDDLKRSLSIIQKYSIRINNLLSNLNDCNKILNGRCAPKLLNYNVIALAENIVQSITPLAARKNISMRFETNAGEKVMATDRLFFERIILNLISNAIKFSGKSSEVKIKLKDETNRIMIEVCDEGDGFSEEQMKKAFRRYETSDDHTNKDGSGIGLAIVREMVASLGGSVFARNAETGKGAVVGVGLPCKLTDNVPPINFADDFSLYDMVQTVFEDI